MTQKDKELLLKDLCARLPYGVMLSTPNGNKPLLALVSSKKYDTICVYDDYCENEDDISEWEGGDIEFVKPYLRPMSSMTEEEKIEYGDRCYFTLDCISTNQQYYFNELYDWLNKNMFDYRGLIEKGLAIAVTESNNPYKE